MTGRSFYDLNGQDEGYEAVSVIWIIDSEQWPRALLRAELIERGMDAVGYLTARDASRTAAARSPDVIVVALRDVTRDDVAQLFEMGAPVIGIAGMPHPEWLHEFPWAGLLRRPVSIGEIADHVLRYIAHPTK